MNLVNLSNYLGIIKISGQDALNFLQGQITNDINLLNSQPYIIASNLNIKGRVITNFFIFVINEEYYLLLNKELVDQMISRLKMYVLRSKVSVIKDHKYIYFSNNTCNVEHNIMLFPDSYICLSQQEIIDSNSNINIWKLFLIKHNIPMIYLITQEKFIPQHIGMDTLNAISFKKGCYIGQEIVARIQYLGSVKRKLFKFSINTKVNIGDVVISPLIENQEVGNVIEVVNENALTTVGLLTMQVNYTNDAYADLTNKFNIILD